MMAFNCVKLCSLALLCLINTAKTDVSRSVHNIKYKCWMPTGFDMMMMEAASDRVRKAKHNNTNTHKRKWRKRRACDSLQCIPARLQLILYAQYSFLECSLLELVKLLLDPVNLEGGAREKTSTHSESTSSDTRTGDTGLNPLFFYSVLLVILNINIWL